MQITHLQATNWRNFKSLDFPLGNRLFIVGPNAAGKSNLLDLFRFIGDVASPAGGLAHAFERRGGLSKVRSLFARNYRGGHLVMEFRLHDDDSDWVYRLAIKGQSGGHNRPIVTEEFVSRDGAVILQRPDDEDARDPERLTQTHLEQIAANQQFRALANHFARVSYFHLVPQVIRDPARRSITGDDPYGSNFIAAINGTPKRTRDAWMRQMQSALQSAVPEFESLGLDVDAAGKPHLRASYRNWRQSPSVQTEAEFSDGTLRLIGLLWTLISAPAGGGVLLLEEPELSLNAAIVRTLPTLLATAQRSRDLQVLLSTHAPEIVDDEGVDPDEVLVLRVTSDGSVATLLSAIPEFADQVDDGLPKSEIIEELISPTDLAELVRAATARR